MFLFAASWAKETGSLTAAVKLSTYRLVQRLKGYRKEWKESESTPNLQIWLHTSKRKEENSNKTIVKLKREGIYI